MKKKAYLKYKGDKNKEQQKAQGLTSSINSLQKFQTIQEPGGGMGNRQ